MSTDKMKNIPTEQQILCAAEKAGLFPNSVHNWIPQFQRYHAALSQSEPETAKAKWNAAADEHNQWCELGQDEKDEFEPEQVSQDHDEAVILLSAVFDAWENGISCTDGEDGEGSFVGVAFKLDDDIFQRCCNLLNRLNPPRNAAPKEPE